MATAGLMMPVPGRGIAGWRYPGHGRPSPPRLLRLAAAWSAMTKRAGQVGCGSRKAPSKGPGGVDRVEQRAVRPREEDAYMSVHMAGQVDRYRSNRPRKYRGLARPRAGRRPPHIPGFSRQNQRDSAGEGEEAQFWHHASTMDKPTAAGSRRKRGWSRWENVPGLRYGRRGDGRR